MRPIDYGLYYSWGNTDGYSIDSGHLFTEQAYTDSTGAAIANDITPQYDCARVALGDRWRMPTAAEFQELIDCTDHLFESIEDVPCIVFRRGSELLVIPLGGGITANGQTFLGERAYLWSSTFYSISFAVMLSCLSDTDVVHIYENEPRRLGLPVRAVSNRLNIPLALVVEQCPASSSSFYGKYIAFGIAGTRRYLIADWKTPSGDPDNEYGCRVFSNLADIEDPESAQLPANQIYLTQAGEDAASLAAFIGYYNEDNPKPIAGVISSGAAMSLINGLLISPTAPV